MESWGASVEARIDDSGIADRIFTDRALLVIAYITGAAGPLHRMFIWLRAHGIGERVIKSTIAAALAYWIARQIPGNPHPTFAPIAAAFSINLTIAGGMHGAGQRVLGVLAGILLAMVIYQEIDNEVLAVGIVVFCSFFIGRQLKLEPTGTQQITMTALLIIFVSDVNTLTETVWLRIVNTLIGTAIGLLANASVAPANLVPQAREETLKLGHAIGKDLQALAQLFQDGISHDRALALLNQTKQTARLSDTAGEAVEQAEESLRYNLQARMLRQTLAHYKTAEAHLMRASFHSRTLARTATDMTAQHAPKEWMAPDALGGPIGDLVQVAANAVQARVRWIELGDHEQPVLLDVPALVQMQSELIERANDWKEQLDRGGIFYLGEIVGLCIQLATEMGDPVADPD